MNIIQPSHFKGSLTIPLSESESLWILNDFMQVVLKGLRKEKIVFKNHTELLFL